MTAIALLTCRFDVSADRLWAMIGDFGNVGKWTGRPQEACTHDGEGIGSLRMLTLDDGRKIVDRLDAQGHDFYTYSIVASPFPVKSYTATMSVVSIGAGTAELTWRGMIDPEGISDEQAIDMFEGFYRYGVGLMQRQIEHAAQAPQLPLNSPEGNVG